MKVTDNFYFLKQKLVTKCVETPACFLQSDWSRVTNSDQGSEFVLTFW